MPDLPFEVRVLPASPAVVYEEPLRFATAEDRDGFLEVWAGVHENQGIPLPVEGVDYELVNQEGN